MLTLEVASEILARASAHAPGAFATRIGMRQQTQDFGAWFVTIAAGEGAGDADVRVVDGKLVMRSDLPADVVAAFERAAQRAGAGIAARKESGI
jgi:hypothetical protein